MRRYFSSVLLAAFLSPALLAQQVDVPIRNWTVPPYTLSSAGGGLTTMTDVTGVRGFVAVAPCRVADTRAIDGFAGQAGGPALLSFTNRNFQITGSPGGVPAPPAGCPANTIPTEADAVSLQFTVVFPSAAGNLVAWQAGGSTPNVSVLNWDAGTVALGSGTILPLSGGGAITVRLNTAAAGQTAHLIIDVNGYFSETLSNTTGNFQLYSSASTFTILGNNSGGGNGIHGHTSTTNLDRAGVFGTQSAMAVLSTYFAHGVRGQGPGGGVLGISTYEGTSGSLIASGNEIAWGALGLVAGVATDPGCPSSPCSPDWGVFAGGPIGATGLKHFLDPHPKDPNLAIAYVSLEGPEAGTYFRGRARFQNGTARITVPEHFRLVTDPEGLTVQITPIGAMATFAVMRMDLNEIVVQASRNVEFSYLVQGVRATFRDVNPVRAVGDFMPRSADAKIPLWLSPAQKRLLIENGTYREDGTVNMETARRTGWDRAWAERGHPEPAASPD